MKKIFEEILWNLYYQTEHGIGGRNDSRFFILNDVLRDIHNFSGKQLSASVSDLKKEKLIEEKKNYEGLVLVSLTEKGMLRAINYRFRRLANKKEKWDGRWRMVFFNIPESRRKGRDALRYRLKTAGFHKLQESIFIFPYECEREIRDFIRLFKMEKYVRFGLMDFVDGGSHIAEFLKLK